MENPYLKNCNSDYLIKEITDWLKLCEKIGDGSMQIPNIRLLQGYIDGLEMKRAFWQDFFSQRMMGCDRCLVYVSRPCRDTFVCVMQSPHCAYGL